MSHNNDLDITSAGAWTCSSYAEDCDVLRALTDGSGNWTSSGQLPHTLRCTFPRPMRITHVSLLPEASLLSFAPSVIEIRAGSRTASTQRVLLAANIPRPHPGDWYDLPLTGCGRGSGVVARVLEINILENFVDGVNSRIEKIRVFGG